MTDLTETTLASEELVDGKLLHVYRDTVRVPDGETSVREWIDHPGAAAVVPLFADGQTLLIRQFRYPARRTFLEVPAGKIDIAGENPEEVAARELEEETGWKAARFTHLASLHPCIGYSNEIIHLYLAQKLTEGKQDLGSGEFVQLVPMSFTEAADKARRGEIADMKSAMALLLAAAHLQNQNAEITTKKHR